MNRFKLSPAARLLVSFAVVIGILVAGRSHPLSPRAAKAQTESRPVTGTASFGGFGMLLQFNWGEIHAPVISAYGVTVDGVPTDFVLSDKIEVVDGFITSDDLTSINGAGISGERPTSYEGAGISGQRPTSYEGAGISGQRPTSYEGAGISGQRPTPYQGAGISGEYKAQDVVIVGEYEVQMTGGQLLGDDISIENGIVSGRNLRIVGATVGGPNLALSGTIVTAPGY